MAWLHSAPSQNDNDKNPLSRFESLEENDREMQLPDVDFYLLNCFNLIGKCLNTGMGITPITWSELNSFLNLSDYELSGWECEQILMMSRSYCNMHELAREYKCKSPIFESLDREGQLEIVRAKGAKKWAEMIA